MEKRSKSIETTLTQTAYKVYAAVLAKRLSEEVASKVILLPSQTGKGWEQ